MLEIRLHGRGGQGAVLASKMLAAAFYADGYRCQAFASYGGERRGAPVTSFLRVDRVRIRERYLIYEPDLVILLDPSLVNNREAIKGCGEGSFLLANTRASRKDFDYPEHLRIACVDASGIAVSKGLGSPTTPLVNTAVIGAFAKISPETRTGVSFSGVEEAIRQYVPSDVEKNIKAAKEAFESVDLQ